MEITEKVYCEPYDYILNSLIKEVGEFRGADKESPEGRKALLDSRGRIIKLVKDSIQSAFDEGRQFEVKRLNKDK